MWYLPENCRGIGTAADQFHKTAETAPEGQGDLCTYVELFGRYTTADGQTTKTTYRVFLGGNNTTDYNLLRNHAYIVHVTLRGQNVSDMRVTIKATALAYTDNADNSRFLLSDEDVSTSSNQDGVLKTYDKWMTGTGTGTDGSLCPEGWRMPTQKEQMLLLAVLPGIPDHGLIKDNSGYWSSTAYSNANNAKWILSVMDNKVSTITASAKYRLRCVKSTESGTKKYPYMSSATVDGVAYPVIVSRDEDGGILVYNRISSKFAVYNEDTKVYSNWANATCPSGWRLPTIEELSLIWVMGGCASTKNENVSGGGNTVGGEELLTGWIAGYTKLYYMNASSEQERYWSSISSGNNIWVLGTITGSIQLYSYTGTNGRTRCIKDID